MWLLTHTTTHEKRYLLTEKQTYSVGRAQADISLDGDNSISRVHAIIHVSTDAIKIEDPGSKYGVYLNANDIKLNQPLTKNEPAALKVGDIVRFGRLSNIWRLERIVLNCCTSTVDQNHLQELLELLRIVNGKYQQIWDEFCTHLVMPNVTITKKVLHSLVHGVPIVTPAYWTAYVEYARANRQQLPNVNDFVPEIHEQYLRNNQTLLHVNLRRQRLFQGKTFVFMTRRHMLAFEPIIKLAHGDCDFLRNNCFTKKHLLKKEIIPVRCQKMDQSQSTQEIHNVLDFIQRNGRRAVNDTELSLAILHCSIDRYCNPDFKMQKCFEVNTIDLTEDNGEIIVEETPESRANESNRAPSTEVILPESIDLTVENASNRQIDSSVVYSEFADAGVCEMAEPNYQSSHPSTSGMNLGKRRRRISSDDAPANEQNAEKKSKSNDIVPDNIEPTPIPESSQSSQSCNLSGFLTTQNRFRKPNTPAPSIEQQSQHTQIAAAERRKRAIAALKSLSDDDDNNNDTDENPFKFASKKPAKKAKLNRMDAAVPTNDNDDHGDDGFNFSVRLSQRNCGDLSQNKNRGTNATKNSSASEDSVLMPFNRSVAENTIRMPHIKRVEVCTDGWLSIAFKRNVSIDNETKAALPSGIKIKEEKLEEWEMSDEEKKRKWLKSLANAIEVKKFNVTITRRSNGSVIDETDGNVSTLTRTNRNFKTFVKKRNYIPQKTVVRTNPVNITINPYARI